MGSCMGIHLNDSESQAKQSAEVTQINSAVEKNEAGALQKMLDEVNQHNNSTVAGPESVYYSLQQESQRAITPVKSEDRCHHIMHLEVSDIWKSQNMPERKE